jgi:hypothetical protein
MIQQLTGVRLMPSVRLTPVAEMGPTGINVLISQMISYSQESGFTRLWLTGRKTLDVKETTDRIDDLVRRASAEG